MDLARIWPPFGLEITVAHRGEEISLRVMRDEDIAVLSDATPADLFGPDIPEHAFGWLFDAHNSPALFRWEHRVQMTPAHWSLDLVVCKHNQVIGSVDMRADDFPNTKSIETGSWIYHRHQGRGIGTLVRHAVAQLSFHHFGAERLTTAWARSNKASAAVSAKLGYTTTAEITVESLGPDNHTAPGVRAQLLHSDYQQPEDQQVQVRGLTPELEQLLGLSLRGETA